jgi:hypothetical protein
LLYIRLIYVNLRGFNRELASSRHGIASIHDQIEKQLLDLTPVYADTSECRATLDTALNLFADQTRYDAS